MKKIYYVLLFKKIIYNFKATKLENICLEILWND